ncbi:glycosyl hydrolase family 43 protein [Morchella snyderi]|nr:glycosyl hydrolase family 43 protein [Morchella snyderi]
MLFKSNIVALGAILFSSTAHASLQIVSGGSWTATNTGMHIQAHGAGVIKVGSTYYLIGENKLDGYSFQSIRCYSSTNLIDWTFVNNLLTLQDSGDLGPNRVVERPKILYNSATSQYVMYMHVDSSNYADAKVGVSTSSSVCGSYTYRGSFRPLGFQSRDMGLYQDSDGAGYLLTEDRENGLRIDRLSDDYLNVTSNVYTWAEKYESPAVIKKNGVYFMFASQLTGWNANDNKYSTATSLSGPWSAWANFATSGSNTYTSQTNYVLTIGDLAMYMGDRWVSSNLMSSTYVWLPLTISGTTASLTWYYNWVINAAAGTWSTPPADNSYEAESSTNTRSSGTQILSCTDCSGGSAVGYIGGSAGVDTLTFNGISSSATTRTTIRMRYTNGDTTQRFADITVNGVTQRIAFVPTGSGQITGVASMTFNLNSGTGNTLKVAGVNGGYAPDVDRIVVPVS